MEQVGTNRRAVPWETGAEPGRPDAVTPCEAIASALMAESESVYGPAWTDLVRGRLQWP